jgi:integrase
MASIRKCTSTTGKAFFRVEWSIYDKDGKRKRESRVFDRMADAKGHALLVETEIERRGVGDADKQTFRVFADRVLDLWRGQDRLAETTLRAYAHHLDILCRQIGHIKLAKLSPLHVDEALVALRKNGGLTNGRTAAVLKKAGKPLPPRPLQPQTLLHAYRGGSLVMQQARRWKLISSNPFSEVTPPRVPKKKIVVMSEDEAVLIYAQAVKAHDSGRLPGIDLAVALLLTTGIRRSELLGLAFDAIDLDKRTISIFRTNVAIEGGQALLRDGRTKSETSTRVLSFSPELTPLIRRHKTFILQAALQWGKAYKREPMLLFCDIDGSPLVPGQMSSRLRHLHNLAGVKGKQPAHAFRHGMASQLVADGVDIRTVADRLGHSTVAFTLSRYVHSVSGKDEEAAALLGTQFRRLQSKANKQ